MCILKVFVLLLGRTHWIYFPLQFNVNFVNVDDAMIEAKVSFNLVGVIKQKHV